ncbi:MAG: ABC transporter ATP-binding protein [Planctomycetota bacterium]
MAVEASRTRFATYRETVRERNRSGRVDRHPVDGSGDAGGSSRKLGTRDRKFLELFRSFWGLVSDSRGSIAIALGLLTISIGLRLIPPLGTKLAIDCVLTKPASPLPDGLVRMLEQLPLGLGGTAAASYRELPIAAPMQTLVWIAVGVTVITVVGTFVNLCGRWMATKSVNRSQVSIRRRVFEHAIRLPLQKVHGLKSGGVASLIREDAGGVAELIFSMLYNPWRAIVQFIGSLIILVFVDWKLMVGGAMLLPIVWLTHRTYINRIRPLFRDVRQQRQAIDSGATETFGGIRVVRTFSRARSESSRFVREGDFLVRQQLFVWWWSRIIETIWEVVIPLASTGLLLYGGYQIIEGDLTLGDLMMFLVYLTMLLDPLATIAGSAVSFQNNLAGLDRILDVLEVEEELPSRPNARVLPSRRSDLIEPMPSGRNDALLRSGDLIIEGLSFSYPGSETPVLRDISLEVPAGQTVALVGRSGAGKTTLTNLIARFYDPREGWIRYHGYDLRDIELASYRAQLGIVEQDVFLFDGSIGENIAYARRRATDEEVMLAAEAAAAHEFISKLPDGYETVIGERGFKLSGGQRQRLAIARAILADPQILVLDEATSNLDSESERLIQDSLSKLLDQRTAFVIAHRLSTITHADQIVVLEEGRIIEVGTHESLIQAGGAYRDMVQLQLTTGDLDKHSTLVADRHH